MKPQNKELALMTIVSLCMLSISILPTYFKTLFVSESGKLEVIWSPILAVVLIGGLFYKSLNVRIFCRKTVLLLTYISIFSYSIIIYMVLVSDGFKNLKIAGFIYLWLLQFIIIYVLRYSKNSGWFSARN
jgi:hypothetical protein